MNANRPPLIPRREVCFKEVAAPRARVNYPDVVQMISATYLHGDSIIWLLVSAGLVFGGLAYGIMSRSSKSVATGPIQPARIAPDPSQPTLIDSDPLPVPTQRVGIPPTALVRITEACGGYIKDGELDIRFELRSRRDCDKMLEALRGIKENLQRTKAVFNNAVSEIRTQLDGPAAAAGKKTGRVSGLFGRDAANGEQFVASKHAELQGYATATRLIDKFILELHGAELSLLDLPFYANSDPVTGCEPQPQC
jgi:hypothetical protein